MPKSVYLIALGIFVMVTSEFIVGGLMPQMAEGLMTTIPRIGYLITAFSLAMAVGGPLATVAVLRLRTDHALLVLYGVFFLGNALAAGANDYASMLLARIITGAASGAFFGVGLSAVARITAPHLRGRAIGIALQGLMVGTLLGLPLSTLIGQQWGWRTGFAAIGVLTIIVAAVTLVALPRLSPAHEAGEPRRQLTAFRTGRLWFAMTTSTLIIGATFAAFSYFAPILTEVAGFAQGAVPLLLLAYGTATVIGNALVARFATSHTTTVLAAGIVLNMVFLLAFALFADRMPLAVIAMLGIGLSGITLNPALVARVQRVGNAGPLVNTIHSSFITMGVVIGSWLGGLVIDEHGLRAPLWTGAALAALALVTLAPDLLLFGRRQRRETALADDAGLGS